MDAKLKKDFELEIVLENLELKRQLKIADLKAQMGQIDRKIIEAIGKNLLDVAIGHPVFLQ